MINQNELTTSKIGVKLQNSPFSTTKYFARVPRNTVTMDALLNSVVEHNQGIDKFQIGHAAELLKREFLEQLKEGRAVSILDIGTIYLAPEKGINVLNPDNKDITGFEARFSPSSELKESLSKITASVTSVEEKVPLIKTIENPLDNSTIGILKSTFSVRLTGKKLKVGGTDSGIFFAPVVEGIMDIQEENWIKVPENFITTNSQTKLEFFLPRELQEEKPYIIVVKSSVTNYGKERKQPIQGFSDQTVTIVA